MNTVKVNTDIQYVKSPSYITFEGDRIKVINDINEALIELKKGNEIARFEFGDSMQPILKNGEYGIVVPITIEQVNIGDAVLCEVNGHLMTHMVMMISDSAKDGRKVLIGNTYMQFYGWTNKVYGGVIGTNIIEMNEEIQEIDENI